MDAKELRKKLDEGLKPDSSGKTTPIQRLTPFLHDLVDYLERTENQFKEGATIRGHLDEHGAFVADSIEQVSSEPTFSDIVRTDYPGRKSFSSDDATEKNEPAT
jgi:hypothetical protein